MRLWFVALVALVLPFGPGCASGGDTELDTGAGGLDVPRMDAPLEPDAPMPGDDAPAPPDVPIASDTPEPLDVPGLPDVPAPDVPVPPDVPRDTPSGPTACTPATAMAVCAGRPCVDGYCCDTPCAGDCDSCNISGLEGTCTNATGRACDDSNACTYGERCTAMGTCAMGTVLMCDAMDTGCRDFSCAGTSTCTSALRPAGTVCDDGNPMTTGDVCRTDGTCAGTTAPCTLPADACATGTETRSGCAGARVIGRRDASGTSGYVVTADTCSASNRFDDCSWDAGNDHAYRIWLRAGETMSAQLSRRGSCFSSWDATLKLYEPSSCTGVTCSRDVWCRDFVGTSAQTYTAMRDGWFVLVVDGSTAFDDEGAYTLTVRLSGCAVAGCGC